jgi:hypothetical protein
MVALDATTQTLVTESLGGRVVARPWRVFDGFQPKQTRLTAAAGEEFSHGAEGFGADVVFDAF